MKDSQISLKPATYYTAAGSPTMNDYRVEKVAPALVEHPYIQLEQPTYADFTNAQVLSHQQEMLQMNFPTPLSTNYMNTAPVTQSQQVPFNIFELISDSRLVSPNKHHQNFNTNLSNFTNFPQSETPLPLLNNSPPHSYSTMPNFSPPPQDPLVIEPKPIKKRMASNVTKTQSARTAKLVRRRYGDEMAKVVSSATHATCTSVRTTENAHCL
ncbi:hypothetical protein L5515_019380 [Caenorhabditis briggsae]|uniref:Uncharacterized protein n=1 Tax=Caenorhabditis briggsae TaxID=6238 RepID=A0AAE9FEM2_CAEBR|nr:hypothetical protein L5515_019380 [Caenorhabditis briggsae]